MPLLNSINLPFIEEIAKPAGPVNGQDERRISCAAACRPARPAGGSQGRKSQKNTPRARAAFQGRTRPFACNSMQPLIQVLPKLVKQHVPLGKNSGQEQHQQKNACRRACLAASCSFSFSSSCATASSAGGLLEKHA